MLGTKEELARADLSANRTNWLTPPPPRAADADGLPHEDSLQHAPGARRGRGLPDSRLLVTFDEPQNGVARKAVVCYDGPRVLGGGWIE